MGLTIGRGQTPSTEREAHMATQVANGASDLRQLLQSIPRYSDLLSTLLPCVRSLIVPCSFAVGSGATLVTMAEMATVHPLSDLQASLPDRPPTLPSLRNGLRYTKRL